MSSDRVLVETVTQQDSLINCLGLDLTIFYGVPLVLLLGAQSFGEVEVSRVFCGRLPVLAKRSWS